MVEEEEESILGRLLIDGMGVMIDEDAEVWLVLLVFFGRYLSNADYEWDDD